MLWIRPDLKPTGPLRLEPSLEQNLGFGRERGLDPVTLLDSGLDSLRDLGSPLDLNQPPDFDLLGDFGRLSTILDPGLLSTLEQGLLLDFERDLLLGLALHNL